MAGFFLSVSRQLLAGDEPELPVAARGVEISSMSSVSLLTARRLRHAGGYLALDMLNEATEELAVIPRAEWALPAVLSARIDLHMAKKEWKMVAGFGEQLARRHPDLEDGWIAWAYALRSLDRIEEAKTVLLEAEPRHGKKSGVLHFNLACYHRAGVEPTRISPVDLERHWSCRQ